MNVSVESQCKRMVHFCLQIENMAAWCRNWYVTRGIRLSRYITRASL